MTSHPTSSESSGVHYQATLPVAWESLVEQPEASTLAAENARNEALLATLLLLDETPAELEDESQPDVMRHLDAKLDLILSLFGEVFAQQMDMPAARPVRLGGGQICIEGITSPPRPAPGAWLRLRLYLLPRIPRALHFTAKVSADETSPRLCLQLVGLSENNQNLLERFVFRQHRRAVAQTRGGVQPG